MSCAYPALAYVANETDLTNALTNGQNWLRLTADVTVNSTIDLMTYPALSSRRLKIDSYPDPAQPTHRYRISNNSGGELLKATPTVYKDNAWHLSLENLILDGLGNPAPLVRITQLDLSFFRHLLLQNANEGLWLGSDQGIATANDTNYPCPEPNYQVGTSLIYDCEFENLSAWAVKIENGIDITIEKGAARSCDGAVYFHGPSWCDCAGKKKAFRGIGSICNFPVQNPGGPADVHLAYVYGIFTKNTAPPSRVLLGPHCYNLDLT